MPAKKTTAKPAKGKKTAAPLVRKAPAVPVRKPVVRTTAVRPARPAAAAPAVAGTRKAASAPAAAPAPVSAPQNSARGERAPKRPATALENRHDRNIAPASSSAAAATVPLPQRAAAPVNSTVNSTLNSALNSASSDADDGDENSSLLAGPRNVQPYVAKRGEQYMNKVQLEHFREILLSWKRDLMEEVDRTVSHMKDEAANFPDPNDRATQEEEFSLELRTRDRERKLIRKIEEALKRIDDGSYGYCLETGEEIGIKRLEARPVATLSIEAQERRERREKQYGDRDDRYR
jgi:DnaK suppressor protein